MQLLELALPLALLHVQQQQASDMVALHGCTRAKLTRAWAKPCRLEACLALRWMPVQQ